MVGSRTRHRKAWIPLQFLSAFLLLSTPHAGQAFEFQKVSDSRELLAAVIEGGASDRFAPRSYAQEMALCVLDFDMAGAREDLALGYGLFWETPADLGYFAAMGAKFPDPATPVGNGGEGFSTPLSLGPWAGAGILWSPRPRLRLALEGRYLPMEVSLGGDEDAATGLQAGLSVAFAW